MTTSGPVQSIGVLGGGQLGRMIALEGRRMGYRIIKWTGGDVSGAAYTADRVLEDPFDSSKAFDDFVASVEVVTIEFENVPVSLLKDLQELVPVIPNPSAVEICQNRDREKRFFTDHGIPCGRFEIVDNPTQLENALRAMNCDIILKTASFGYDGKGQHRIKATASSEHLQSLWGEFNCPRGVAEEVVSLAAEVSVLVARSLDGNVVTYDPAENIHSNHILDLSIVPARLPAKTLKEARELAMTVAETLDYHGILAVELFLTTDGRLLVNELAPRPHNSGHHTLDACYTSQFEQQLRIVSHCPLGSPHLRGPAVLWNLMGELWEDESTAPDWTPILQTPGAQLHLYGKRGARTGRKMGHVTFLADSLEAALAHAGNCRRAFGLVPVPAAEI